MRAIPADDEPPQVPAHREFHGFAIKSRVE